MAGEDFVREIEAFRDERLRWLADPSPEADPPTSGVRGLLEVALTNEIGASELAAAWVPSTAEVDVKLALARQAGDEARHFGAIASRLRSLGFDPDHFTPPGANPLFDYLRSLETTAERIAGGLVTLEAIAYGVNETFMVLCAGLGDSETVRIYRDFIQPDERAHQQMGRELLARHVVSSPAQGRVREVVAKTLDLASAGRADLARKLGTHRFPGC